MRKLGQHFLKNNSVVRKLVDAIDVQKGDSVLEIGPGRGALTLQLAEACAAAGATLMAIEKDAGLAAGLAATAPGVSIITGDALKELPRIANGEHPGAFPIKLVGNLPYYITGHLLRIVGEMDRKPIKCVFMVQREVAERMISVPPRMNRLAASVQFWAAISVVARVSKEDFSPPPDVESAVIVLEVKNNEKEHETAALYYRAVRTIFAQPRKTLINNLSAAFGERFGKEALAEKLATLGIKPDARPQDVGPGEIERIAKIFF